MKRISLFILFCMTMACYSQKQAIFRSIPDYNVDQEAHFLNPNNTYYGIFHGTTPNDDQVDANALWIASNSNTVNESSQWITDYSNILNNVVLEAGSNTTWIATNSNAVENVTDQVATNTQWIADNSNTVIQSSQWISDNSNAVENVVYNGTNTSINVVSTNGVSISNDEDEKWKSYIIADNILSSQTASMFVASTNGTSDSIAIEVVGNDASKNIIFSRDGIPFAEFTESTNYITGPPLVVSDVKSESGASLTNLSSRVATNETDISNSIKKSIINDMDSGTISNGNFVATNGNTLAESVQSDGSIAMTGTLNLDGNNISGVNQISGVNGSGTSFANSPTDFLSISSGAGFDFNNRIIEGPLDPTAGTQVGDRDYNDSRYALSSNVTASNADFQAQISSNAVNIATNTETSIKKSIINDMDSGTISNGNFVATNGKTLENSVQNGNQGAVTVVATNENPIILKSLDPYFGSDPNIVIDGGETGGLIVLDAGRIVATNAAYDGPYDVLNATAMDGRYALSSNVTASNTDFQAQISSNAVNIATNTETSIKKSIVNDMDSGTISNGTFISSNGKTLSNSIQNGENPSFFASYVGDISQNSGITAYTNHSGIYSTGIGYSSSINLTSTGIVATTTSGISSPQYLFYLDGGRVVYTTNNYGSYQYEDIGDSLYARSSDVTASNADFQAQISSNSVNIATNANDISDLDLNKIDNGGALADLGGGSGTTFLRKDGTWSTPSSTGDVTGPSSSTDSNFVLFDGTTGKLVKDDGISASTFLATAGTDNVKDWHIDWGSSLGQVNANDVPILDTGGYFSPDTVESALQHLASDHSIAGATNATTGFSAGNNASATEGGAVGYTANTTLGFAGGRLAQSTIGGSIGQSSETTDGGSAGYYSFSSSGGAVGYQATTGDGGAVGNYATSDTGFAGGDNSGTDTGGGSAGANSISQEGGFAGGNTAFADNGSAAVGNHAKSLSGFAGGNYARANNTGNIQIGTGTNSTANTLQIWDYPLLDSAGDIPAGRMTNNLTDIYIAGEWTNTINDLVTLSGVSANSTNLGTFTGTTIDDNLNVKEAFQDLETTIEALGGGHDPVTLDANADDILTLSTQEIGLSNKTANIVFAGPSSGGAAVPSFRALVDDDIPDNITITESDPNALLTAGTDNVKDTHIDWGTGAGQVSPTDFADEDIGDISIVSGSWTLDTDSVSANELDATGVETELEGVLDLQDLQGAVTDAQVPNDITISALDDYVPYDTSNILFGVSSGKGGSASQDMVLGYLCNSVQSPGGIVLGRYSQLYFNGTNSMAIGSHAEVLRNSTSAIAMGDHAQVTNAVGAIQLGTGTNTTANSFQVFDYQLLDSNGYIPIERMTNELTDVYIPNDPSATSGNYIITNGTVSIFSGDNAYIGTTTTESTLGFGSNYLVVDNSGADFGGMYVTNASDYATGGGVSLTNLSDTVDDLVTLSGVSANSTNLGTFTGTTIDDNLNVKEAFQDLETTIEGLGGGHDAVTLDANADTLLSLSTQELGLDTQTANTVFAGPSAGGAAVPTFRALVDDDIPDTITITESDPNALLTAGTDNVKDTHIDWGTGAGQVSPTDFADEDIGDISIVSGVWSLDANTVSANELNGAGVESELEGVLDLQDLQGAVTDAQVPNDITITESDPNALLTAGTDNVKDTHIDWGTGAGQVSAADVPIVDSGSYYTSTDVEGGLQEIASIAVTESETFTIMEPDAAQGVSDHVLLKFFPAEKYPNGVTMVAIHVGSSASYTSETFTFEESSSPTDSTPSTIEVITLTGSSTGEDDGSFSDGSIAADGYVFVNLDDTPEDVAYVCVTLTYTVD